MPPLRNHVIDFHQNTRTVKAVIMIMIIMVYFLTSNCYLKLCKPLTQIVASLLR